MGAGTHPTMVQSRGAPAVIRRSTGRPRTVNSEAVGIRSVEIALDVLKAFYRLNGEASLTELSHATGMPASKLHRYLVSLARGGLIVRSDTTGLYDLGPTARTLGAVALTRFDDFETISNEMKRLSVSIGQSVFIYVWAESGPVMARQYASKHSPIFIKVGSTLPLLTSGCGPLFLAYLSGELTGPVLEAELQRDSAVSATTATDLAERVRRDVSKEGCFWVPRGVLPGAWVCAAPIFDALGELSSVLGVAVGDNPGSIVAPNEIKQALASSAAELSRSLGFHEDRSN